jgi:hypothetical protein
MNEFQDFQEEVKKRREKRNEKLREKYQLARKLGFSCEEAMVLQFKSLNSIQKLAEEKKRIENEN